MTSAVNAPTSRSAAKIAAISDGGVRTACSAAATRCTEMLGAITLVLGADVATDTSAIPGSVRLPPNISVQRVAAALHAVRTPPSEIAAIFAALREVGALTAEVIVR